MKLFSNDGGNSADCLLPTFLLGCCFYCCAGWSIEGLHLFGWQGSFDDDGLDLWAALPEY